MLPFPRDGADGLNVNRDAGGRRGGGRGLRGGGAVASKLRIRQELKPVTARAVGGIGITQYAGQGRRCFGNDGSWREFRGRR